MFAALAGEGDIRALSIVTGQALGCHQPTLHCNFITRSTAKGPGREEAKASAVFWGCEMPPRPPFYDSDGPWPVYIPVTCFLGVPSLAQDLDVLPSCCCNSWMKSSPLWQDVARWPCTLVLPARQAGQTGPGAVVPPERGCADAAGSSAHTCVQNAPTESLGEGPAGDTVSVPADCPLGPLSC